MNCNFKKKFLFLLIFSFFFYTHNIVFAEEFTIEVRGTRPESGIYNPGTLIKRTTGPVFGKRRVVYCADHHLNFPSIGYANFVCRDYDRGKESSIKKIFEESKSQGIYPGWSRNFQKEYVDTQIKIWKAVPFRGTIDSEDIPNFSLKGNNKLKVELDDPNYYKSSPLKLNGPGTEINVSVSIYDNERRIDGAFITKGRLENEKDKVNTVKNNETFFIKVPFDKIDSDDYKVVLNVSSDTEIDNSKLYICLLDDPNEFIVSRIQELLLYIKDDEDKKNLFSSEFSFKPITYKKCTPDYKKYIQNSCNGNIYINTNCDHISIINHEKNFFKNVEIHQTGNITNIITPENLFAGGGFQLNVMYTNNIKWNYLDDNENYKYHSLIVQEMNKKIKDNKIFEQSININNVKLNNKNYKDMKKRCWSSSNSLDYYGDDGLTFTCVFTFPNYSLNPDGSITRIEDNSFNLNSKYYIPLGFSSNKKYPIKFDLVGLNRLTDYSIENDTFKKSSDKIRWTDNSNTDLWNSSHDCSIDVYSLFYNKNGKYNFIYRPIDITKPFPNRYPGANWYDWYKKEENVQRLINTYDSNNLEYVSYLSKENISKLKNKYKDLSYFDWSTVVNGKNNFIDDSNGIILRK